MGKTAFFIQAMEWDDSGGGPVHLIQSVLGELQRSLNRMKDLNNTRSVIVNDFKGRIHRLCERNRKGDDLVGPTREIDISAAKLREATSTGRARRYITCDGSNGEGKYKFKFTINPA